MTLNFSMKTLLVESHNKIYLFLLTEVAISYVYYCFQVNTTWYQQCYLWENPVCGRPGSGVAAAGVVHLHSSVGCLPIPVGDNAVDLFYNCTS